MRLHLQKCKACSCSIVTRRTFLHILGGALSLVRGLWHLLNHVIALLSRGWETLLDGDIRALLVILHLLNRNLLVLANLLGYIVTDFTSRWNIMTNSVRGGFTSLLVNDRTLLFSHFLDADAGNKETELSWLVSAVLDRNLVTGLHGDFATFNLGNLVALELGNIGALLLGNWTALLVSCLLAFGSGDILAFFLLDGITYSLRDIVTELVRNLATFLLGHVMTLLAGDVLALLLIVNLLADLLVDSVTFLSVGGLTFLLVVGLTLTTMFSPTLLFWDLVALPIVDNLAVLLWNILTNLVLNISALLLEDNVALGCKVSHAPLLRHRFTFVLIPCGTLLVILRGTLFLMDSFLDILWKTDTLELGGIVAFLVGNLGALLLYVIDSVTILLVVERAHHLGSVVTHWPLGYLTSPFLSVTTDRVLNIVTLLPCH